MKLNCLAEIEKLDPETDHCRIVYLTICDGFMWDITRSLELALFRTFAAPSIGRLLHRTGEFENNGQKRYDDTTLLLLSILRYGYDSEVGRRAITRMNKTHSHFPISNEDYLFVLSTFVIDPISWIERFGWRKFCDKEKRSLFLFWHHIGQRMGLQSLPNSLDQMEAESWAYVDNHFAFDDANQSVAQGTVNIVKAWLPRILGRFVEPVAASLLDARTRAAVGMKSSSVFTDRTVMLALKTRSLLKRLIHRGREPDWPSGDRTYPHGYVIEDLAPKRLLEIEDSEAVSQKTRH